MDNIITYVPEPHWLWTYIRAAAYGALAGVCINAIMKWL